MRDSINRIRARIAFLKMEEVLLERLLKTARDGQHRYKAMEENAEEMLDACRIEIVNHETTLDQSSTVY
jgi:hypothetical protein